MGKLSQFAVAAAILAVGLLSVSATARPCKTFFVTSYSFSFGNPNDPFSSSASAGFVTVVTEISQLSLKQSDPKPSGVFTSLRERSRDILSVVVALLFGVGCGALTGATLYLVWSLFSTRSDYHQAFLEEDESDGELSPKKIGYVNIPTVNVKETP
ncbi:NC domain-containing protein-related [Hibiscus syriacus]|uniref:NC domain-containing protein-related n=1 Tax=Hibiscus syriacus TaxID=106335 RepID=A0A6A2ZYC8_HIBSY|nr:uncharacterized protein LOC120136755 [Hibiscus syriacus]KAE8696868.1 NC domain-containing protein-related [Hibiscus syriacus]